MKKLLLIPIICLYGLISNAQNGALYGQWYLLSYEYDGFWYSVSEITPNVSPDLFIDQDLNFNGFAACNSYSGNFNHSPGYVLNVDVFNSSTDVCDYQSHTDFEADYFGFYNIGNALTYSIIWDNNGIEYLEMMPEPGYTLYFGPDPPLSGIPDENELWISIYPNPVLDILRIENTSTAEITSLKLYDLLGRLVLAHVGNLEQIDVSHLDSGVLFVEIKTDQGVIAKKIIKE